jgi:hypothetical protein
MAGILCEESFIIHRKPGSPYSGILFSVVIGLLPGVNGKYCKREQNLLKPGED